ncbi:MAG: hypothetical protein JNK93_15660 [Planctomycetia bacterium]|nr:hypothetical protein [Planctomycetia bacterium]
MNLREFQELLARHPNAPLHFALPDGDLVPAHFHVTEVGRIRKDFIDCGGTTRSESSCRLQVWIASDTDHRLNTTKLAAILKLATPLFDTDELPVEVEYEAGVVSQYPVTDADATPSGLLFQLGSKHTDCLAKDRCGVPLASAEGCAAPGCC